jgi:FkbM family methyltransferase
MEIDPLEWTQSDLIKNGSLEPLTSALYGKLLRAGDTYVDVGAHIGFHTLVARHYVGASGRVIAVEPQPYNCHKLLANWRANDFHNLVVYVAAAGTHNGSVALHHQIATDTTRLSLCLAPVNDQPQVFYVPMMRLETIFDRQAIDHARLLKIDIEGYELKALEGIGPHTQAVDNIILEVLDTATALAPKSVSLLEKLERLGYELRTVEGHAWNRSSALPENNLWASRNNQARDNLIPCEFV